MAVFKKNMLSFRLTVCVKMYKHNILVDCYQNNKAILS